MKHMLNLFRIYLFIFTALLTAFFGTIFFTSFCFLLFFGNQLIYRTVYDYILGTWQWLAACLLEKLLGIRVVITGDKIDPNEQGLILMNHRTCFDWMYFWSVLIRQSTVRTEKIVLKSPLKYVPGAGWAIQGANYFFLERKWDIDEPYINMLLQYFRSLNYKTQILLYPEGTDLSERAKSRSNVYAKENGLTEYKYILHPRTTGFVHMASKLREDWSRVYVYDVTISYNARPPQNESEFVGGMLPDRVYYHVKKYSLSDLPSTKEELADWCQKIWSEKEGRLEKFYLGIQEGRQPPDSEPDPVQFRILVYVTILLWAMFLSWCVYCCFHSTYFLMFVAVQTFFYSFLTKLGGLDRLTSACYCNSKKSV